MAPQLQSQPLFTNATPVCPKCGHVMAASTREPKATLQATTARVGSPPAPRPSLAVWRCTPCGIDRPRFD